MTEPYTVSLCALAPLREIFSKDAVGVFLFARLYLRTLMPLLQQFQQHIKTSFPFLHPQHSKLLLAVSGGVDSVVLAHLFAKAGYSFTIAHCNFQLRGDESTRDEQFVKALGETYNMPVLVKHFDTQAYAAENKLSIQEAARKLRYDWFEELIKAEKAKAKDTSSVIYHLSSVNLITAHHANDNIETLLINFFRGTGISGLHAIPAKQGDVIRPLLFAKRDDIVAYAKEEGLSWVEDSSNASDKYTRNFIRLQMLPAAREIFSNAEDNLLQNIERFKEAEILYKQAVEQHKKKLLQQKGNEWHVPILKLQKTQPLNTIVWEVIKDFGFNAAQTGEIIKLLQAGSGSYITSSTHRVINNRGWLIIAPVTTEEPQHILVEESDKKIMFVNGTLTFDVLPAGSINITNSNLVAMLDARHIQYPLLLRKYKQGDYFYPLGMQKKKKLNRFFIDQKLSATDKEKVWVLEMDKKIVWVVGLRIDDRFKVQPSTQQVLKITLC